MILLRKISLCAMILAFMVVMLGAYTRLTHAGLGCPDWPGCYGHMLVPTPQTLSVDQLDSSTLPIEARKAWTEMIHRYIAGTLVLLVLSINMLAWRYRHQGAPRKLPGMLLGLIVCQALLGMWTVTFKLLPIVVMGHLLGGLLLFGGLVYLNLLLFVPGPRLTREMRGLVWIKLAIGIVLCQIMLGGWVSANYAGLACVGFPQCNGHWWPYMTWQHSFQLWSSIGTNYQGGVLDNASRVTIQMVHRCGAVVTIIYLVGLAIGIWRRTYSKLVRNIMGLVVLCVMIQIGLGIVNVLYLLPLWVAVAHNGMAALLFASILSVYFCVRGYPNARYF